MATATWNGSTGSYADPTQWSTGAVPGSGDVAIINSGTVNANGLTFSNITVGLNANSSVGGTLNMINDTINADSTLSINDANSYGSSPAPILAFQGTTTNNGSIVFQGTTTTVSFSAGANLVNTGTISIAGASPQVQTGSGQAAASITNNGTIAFTNPSSVFQSPIINASVGGTGTISLGTKAAASFRSSIGSGQTVAFTGGVNANSALEIDQSTTFAATVSGFVSGDRLIVASIPYSNYTYTSSGSSSGTLTLYSGSTVEASINLSGVYSAGTFTVTANALGSSGLDNVIITTSVQNSATGSTSSGSGSGSTTVGAVYRFFDKNTGTHFFTSDVGERNTTRTLSNYVQETNDFGNVAQTDTSAETVYRFFDTRFGTHFFTASASERDTVINTRSDLIYEPNSIFYEHATQQSGDVPVYRFFDTQFGTHFYTGDAAEAANVATLKVGNTNQAAYTAEGVGFYAPSGSFT